MLWPYRTFLAIAGMAAEGNNCGNAKNYKFHGGFPSLCRASGRCRCSTESRSGIPARGEQEKHGLVALEPRGYFVALKAVRHHLAVEGDFPFPRGGWWVTETSSMLERYVSIPRICALDC
jgi:hypothetical protein